MKIMFIGSIPNHRPGGNQEIKKEHQALFDAAKGIGYAASKKGHRIIIGSTSPRTIDRSILDGAIQFCMEVTNATVHVEVHRPDSEDFKIEILPPNLHILHIPRHADKSSPHKWIVAHARATDDADIIISLAGGVSTRIIGHLVADRGQLLIPVPNFGGSSKDLYQLIKYSYVNLDIGDIKFNTLFSDWNESSAHRLIEFAENIVKENNSRPAHSYFLSYSWKDCAAADHIELLLRRSHRVVLRDESNFRPGSGISSQIEALIEECDTFVALWSVNYQDSEWCPNELSFAINLNKSRKKPFRIILLSTDNTSPPLRNVDDLRLSGESRNDRTLSVSRLIQGEN